MEHTAEKMLLKNSFNMTIAKEPKPVTDLSATSKDIFYLLYSLIQAMNKGLQ